MYDVIYFNVWSDIICTAAKLLHGTSEKLSNSQTFLCSLIFSLIIYFGFIYMQ